MKRKEGKQEESRAYLASGNCREEMIQSKSEEIEGDNKDLERADC